MLFDVHDDVVDPTFPSTALEQFFCACLMDVVSAAPSLNSDQYLDLLLLAIRHESASTLLTGKERTSFKQAAKQLSEFNEVASKPPWTLIVNSLQGSSGIKKPSGNLEVGPDWSENRKLYPKVSKTFIQHLCKAGERLREIQESAAPDDQFATIASETKSLREEILKG